MLQEPTVSSITAARGQGVRFGVVVEDEDISSMARGKWMNSQMATMLGEALYNYSRVFNDAVLLDSLITGDIVDGKDNRSIQFVTSRMTSDVSVGVLHVNKNHWVAFSVVYSEKEHKDVFHPASLRGYSVGDIVMRVLEPMLPAPGTVKGVQSKGFIRYNWGRNSKEELVNVTSSLNEQPDYVDKCEKLLAWHCQVWSRVKRPTHYYHATIRFEGTGQQVIIKRDQQQRAIGYDVRDCWSCGRWAVANIAVLLAQQLKGWQGQPPCDYDLVESWLMRLAELVVCGKAEGNMNPLRMKHQLRVF